MESVKQKWNGIYAGLSELTIRQHIEAPAAVLLHNDFLLPPNGKALDLACGVGANALFLARRGFAVTAWDISTVAIDKLQAFAAQHSVEINACACNIDAAVLQGQQFDIIVVHRFLDRALTCAIISALNSGGVLFYQTYTQIRTSSRRPRNPAYLLAPGELWQLFSPLQSLYYRDNALQGNLAVGLRDEAQFIGLKV